MAEKIIDRLNIQSVWGLLEELRGDRLKVRRFVLLSQPCHSLDSGFLIRGLDGLYQLRPPKFLADTPGAVRGAIFLSTCRAITWVHFLQTAFKASILDPLSLEFLKMRARNLFQTVPHVGWCLHSSRPPLPRLLPLSLPSAPAGPSLFLPSGPVPPPSLPTNGQSSL